MNLFQSSTRTIGSALLFTFIFSGFNTAVGATLDISQKPLILSESVAPNLIFTLDDSGSMRWAFGPDDAGREDSPRNLRNTRRGMSSTTNPMYYNPNVTYRPPVKLNNDGSEVENGYTSSFTTAYQNGFQTSYGSINLSNNYRVSWNFSTDEAVNYNYSSSVNYADPTGRIFNLSQNPNSDFGTVTYRLFLSGTSGASSRQDVDPPPSIIPGLGRVRVQRTTSGTNCTATFISGSYSGSISCSRDNNDYTISLSNVPVPAYYYVYDPSLAGCNANKNNDACHRPVFVSENSSPEGTDERANFAIWYSFYRTRALATVTAANLAFNELAASSRFTWQTLAVCNTLNSNNCNNNYFRELSPRHKANFLNWLASVKFNSSTPLLAATARAGEFLRTSSDAWAHTPNPVTTTGGRGATIESPVHACRPSFHVLMTDGMWNDENFPGGITRHDGATFTLPDGSQTYSPSRKPYGNDLRTTTGTLADIAMHYWATDLRPTLENDVKPYIQVPNTDATAQYWEPKNNPATWQHMVNYTMGLALTNSLNAPNLPWTGDTFGGSGYENLLSGAQSWPEASRSSSNNVYDLWHAAINSRGEFFSVDSPDDMVKAFKDILNRIANRTTSAARPAVAASFVSDSDNALQSNVYATQFSSEDWSGELSKTLVDKTGGTTLLWSAKQANENLDPSTRRVLMFDSTASNKLKNFTWNNLSTQQQNLMNRDPESLGVAFDTRGQDRVNYVRGDRSKEGVASPQLRKRSSILGDIINSSPAVVGTPAYLAYLADAIENPTGNITGYRSYAAFREANKKANRQEMIYVGGNDGMLHGFNATTGQETFAFIPSEVIQNLHKLTGQNYKGGEHQYFVDGTPIVRDVYFGNGDDEGWRTVLIGTLRAGGKSLFALDVTDPTQIKLLWEFDSTKDADLGFTFAQPEIVRLHTGEWAVLQGNGYNSTNDKAALLIINIKSGELIKKITVPDVVEGNITLSNGLSSVRGADNNGDGLVDYAYAGDLQGNLWRFDLVKTTSDIESITSDPFARTNDEVASTTAATDFKLAYGNKPLFVARDTAGKRQAITIQPSLVRHPTSYGYLVLFGTGKYLETSDANVDTSRAMTLYGIWDRNTKRQSTTANTPVAGTRTGRLLEQSFTEQQNNVVIGDEEQSATRDIRLVSQKPAQWFRAPTASEADLKIPSSDELVTQWGWALDMAVQRSENPPAFKFEGEMIINNMTASGSILFLSSLTPNQDPCQAGADTWLYAVDAFTGGRTRFNVLDLNADRLVNPTDQYNANVVSGMRFPALGGFTLAPGNKVFGSDGAADPATVGDDPNSSGRQSWHIVPEEFQ
ncbi:pilus assembly protein [Pseudomonas wenzhouensis]|uniref:pilus assembly protein n=1 Tax=Pseudomonas wenzhouensis TaxID=2906062 RepID=UPI001E4AEB2B|nr:PilC/PilY family type IV pilus protein [Pseudomonas wenzhouensis]UFQ98498.1 pilus assembly protein PilY [Pseudomonas wenzhouensis]